MKKKYVKIFAVLITIAMMAMMIAACASDDPVPAAPEPITPEVTPEPTPTPTPEPAGLPEAPEVTAQTYLRVLAPSLAVSMDPTVSNDSASADFARLVYSTLVLQDYNTFEPLPSLATSWEFIDAQTLTMEIRQGVTFHNGDPMTTEDVAFSLTRAGAATQVAPILGMIDTVTADSDTTITINLEIPFAPILRHLAHPAAGIVPMNYINEIGDEAFAEAPVGTGPFMFDELVIGDQYRLLRNENYWGDVPVIEEIIWRLVPDPSTRLIEVSTGSADVAMAIAPADIAVADGDPNVNLMRRLSLGTDMIWMNAQRPYLENPLVRQAINYAIDTLAIIDVVFMGAGAPVFGPVAPIVWGYQSQEPFDVNPDRARELLAEAGLADGFDLEIWWNTPNTQRQQVSEMVQHALGQIGINVTIDTMEWADYLARADNAEHDMMIIGWTTVTGDVDYALFPLLHSTNYGAPGNRGFWSTPELDALLEQGRSELDPAARMEIYAQAQAIIRENAPMIVLRQGEILNAVNPLLRGLTLSPNMSHNYAPVWFDVPQG